MHISSLPVPYGIGTMGDNAYRFVDFLQRAGQTWWQILPIGPTSYGDSPYQSFSSVAGNPYFIDLPQLERDGLLERDEYERLPWCESELSVDYGQLYQLRYEVLHHAYRRFAQQHRELYWLVMDTAAGEPRVLDDAAARFTEPLKQVFSGFYLPPQEAIHFRRRFWAIVHGFASQEDEGFFSHYPASTDESFEFAIQRFIDCIMDAEKRNPT